MSASVCMHCSPLTLIVQHGIKSPSVSLTCVSKNKSGERFYSNSGWLSSTSGKFYRCLNELLRETEPRSGSKIPAIKQAPVRLDASLETGARLFFGPLSGTGQISPSKHLSFPRCRHGRSHTHLVVPAGHWRGDFSAVGRDPRRRALGPIAFLGSRSGYPFLPLALTGGRCPGGSGPGRDLLSLYAPTIQPRDGEVLPVEDRQPGHSFKTGCPHR